MNRKISSNSAEYSSIFKSISLFGGVQVFTIIVSLVRSKVVALLIGAYGLGVIGLLTNTLDLIKALTNLGLDRSAVKNIALSNSSEDIINVSNTYAVLRRLIWWTGLMGSILTFFGSKWISQITFGNGDYTFGFQVLSIIILVNQFTAGQLALLRGLRKLKMMAYCTMIGSVLGLIVSVPIYYQYGVDGIVPSIFFTSLIAWFLSLYYTNKIQLVKAEISKFDFASLAKDMSYMGVTLTISSLVSLIAGYLIRIYLRSSGAISDVGYYTAGFTIINTYFGLIFTSLTTDYYPKLAIVASDFVKSTKLMNQQSEMTLLLISPILSMFLVLLSFVIPILYTDDFITIERMVIWSCLGIFFKSVSWSLGVIFISKGESKYVLFTEVVTNTFLVFISYFAYRYYGLEGLGIAFFISFLITYVFTFVCVKIRYDFSYSDDFCITFLIQFSLAFLSFLVSLCLVSVVKMIFGFIFVGVSILYSLYRLDKLMNIRSFLVDRFK